MSERITYTSTEGNESFHAAYEMALEGIAPLLGQVHPIHIGPDEIMTGRQFEVRSPIDRSILIGSFQSGGEGEAEKAVATAADGSADWDGTPWKERVAAVRSAADDLDRKKYELAALVTLEVGKNRFEAIAEVAEAVDMIRYNCRVFLEHEGFVLPMSPVAENERSESVMRPYGVFAVISPFNFPLALAGGMTSAALLAGNTVVFKPASASPLCGLMLYLAYRGGGVPPGAIHLVTGPGKPFGSVVTSHPLVDGIAFTGSRDAGMWLYRTLAANQPFSKPLVAEMGSKNPVIITPAADLDAAVEGVVRSAFGYGGQKCSATSRVYVDSRVAESFLGKLRERTDSLRVGDPREKDVYLGPLVEESAAGKFREAVELARKDGGTIATGGTVLEGGLFGRGSYVRPTIVTGLPHGHHLTRDELFVPFVVVETVSSLDEAIRAANDTEYGLTAGIFSRDAKEISRFFSGIRFGVCYANRKGGATTGAWPGAQPFTGWKASGSTGKGTGGPYYPLSFMREQARTRAT
ncbi:MAG: aldehyde dehydrogenase family protein [Methanoregulaceae archaeon]|nr:aldehyde dehydrogenase family protein [Methanoregulaceae archaeon]